ncbi:MAG: hypothetical protein SGPRY_004231, partial [Prymnesium sp.]
MQARRRLLFDKACRFLSEIKPSSTSAAGSSKPIIRAKGSKEMGRKKADCYRRITRAQVLPRSPTIYMAHNPWPPAPVDNFITLMREKGTILPNGGLATPNGASFSRISQPPTRSRCEAMLHDAFAGLSGMRMVEELAQLARAKLSMAELLELRYKIDVMLQGREALVLRDSYTASSASIACALSTDGRSRGSTGQGCSGSRAMTSRTDSRAGLGFADQTPPRALLDPLGRAAPAPRFTAHAGTERLRLRVASRQHILLPPQTARPAPQLLTAAMPSEPGGAAIVTHRRISDEAREMLAEIGARGQSDFREARKGGSGGLDGMRTSA